MTSFRAELDDGRIRAQFDIAATGGS